MSARVLFFPIADSGLNYGRSDKRVASQHQVDHSVRQDVQYPLDRGLFCGWMILECSLLLWGHKSKVGIVGEESDFWEISHLFLHHRTKRCQRESLGVLQVKKRPPVGSEDFLLSISLTWYSS